MRATDVHKLLAHHTGYPVREIDQRTRWMHRLGMIRPGRGRSAPQLDVSLRSPEIPLMLLSLCSRRAVDAEKTAMRLAGLRPVPRTDVPAELAMNEARILTVALALILMSEAGDLIETGGKRLDVHSIEMSETGSFAWILFQSGTRLLYTDDKLVRQAIEEQPESYDAQFTARIDRRLYVGGPILADIALSSVEPDAGWAEDALAEVGSEGK